MSKADNSHAFRLPDSIAETNARATEERERHHSGDIDDFGGSDGAAANELAAEKAMNQQSSRGITMSADLTSHELPKGIDLIFSRDSLQHLPLRMVLECLRRFQQVMTVHYYLLVLGGVQKCIMSVWEH